MDFTDILTRAGRMGWKRWDGTSLVNSGHCSSADTCVVQLSVFTPRVPWPMSVYSQRIRGREGEGERESTHMSQSKKMKSKPASNVRETGAVTACMARRGAAGTINVRCSTKRNARHATLGPIRRS